MSEEDAAPRIKELRAEQGHLQKVKDEISVEIENDKPAQLDAQKVMEYAADLKAVLAEGTFSERKAFLRSFIKRIEFEPGKVAISYTIPMPVEKDRMALDEVLSMEPIG